MEEFPFGSARNVWERYGWMWWALERASNQGRAEVPVLTSNSSITGLVTSRQVVVWGSWPTPAILETHPTLGQRRSRPSRRTNVWLTRGWLVAVVSMSEVLGILHHWDASHPYDNRIRTRVQSTRGDDPVVDMMKRAGGVFLTADDSNWTWKDTQRQLVSQTFWLFNPCCPGLLFQIWDRAGWGASDLSAWKRLLRTLVSL